MTLTAELVAGRELDAQIAEKVMGLELYYPYPKLSAYWGQPWVVSGGPVLPYSTDIAAAWLVMEKLVQDGTAPALINDDFGHWAVAGDGMQNMPPDCDGSKPFDVVTTFCVDKEMWADTAPLAICKFAYRGVSE